MDWNSNRTIAWVILIFVIALCLWLIFGDAMAQEIVVDSEPVVDETSWLYATWEIVQPIVTVLVSVVGPALAFVLAGQLVKLLGIKDADAQAELEKKLRDALHQAALNALKYAISKNQGPVIDMVTHSVPQEILQEAIGYVERLNPEGFKSASEGKIQDIILSKVPDVMAILAAREAPVVVNELKD